MRVKALDLHATGVAFSVDAEVFTEFVLALPSGIPNREGEPLTSADIVDFDLCWAIDLCDPWGNLYELNCYDYDRIEADLIDAHDITPQRYWPREVFDGYPQT